MQCPSRRGFLAGGAALAGSLAGCLGSGGAGTSGMTIETLSVAGLPGDTIPVAPDGTVTLLDFFATWCAPCKPQMAHLRTIHQQYADVHMLSVTWESDTAAVRSFWKEYEGTWPVALDPEVKTGEQFGVTRIPTLLVLDGDGTEVWRHVGLAASETIATHLDEALGAT